MNKKNYWPYLLISAIAAILYLPFLGHVRLFDWDEINFAECAREMLITRGFLHVQINYHPFYEKPPLFIWMQALSMMLFGVNEFAARFPNALCGILTLIVLFFIGKKEFSSRFGWWWMWAYAGSILPQFYFKSGIIDPWFNLFIFLSVYQNFILERKKNLGQSGVRNAVYTAIFLGLAVLTKGPVALIIFILCWLASRLTIQGRKNLFNPELLILVFVTIIVSSSWFVMIWFHDGSGQLKLFINYQWKLLTTGEAGHGEPFYYHWVILLFGCFPASVLLFLRNKNPGNESSSQIEWKNYMWIMLLVVLILFSIVKTKIVHYSSLCYFPLTFLAARSLYLHGVEWKNKTGMNLLFWIIGLSISCVLILLPYLGTHIESVSNLVLDPFTKENMKTSVQWPWWTFVPGIIFLISIPASYLLHKRFQNRFLFQFAATILVIQLSQLFIVPRIEKYTQDVPASFYQSLKGKDVYVEVYGMKSYAHLFYFQKPFEKNNLSIDSLLDGKITKPAYFVARIDVPWNILNHQGVKEVFRKNGFVFYRRDP